MKYLDPKADLTFKKVFGEHPELVKSLLNALLPFKREEEEITSVTYLTPEMVPQTPTRKYSIVDVRCEDAQGRQFIVEMQMVWSAEFKQRVLQCFQGICKAAKQGRRLFSSEASLFSQLG